MRLRFVEHTSPEDRRALKPAVGDTVLYEQQKYIVTEVGLKYVRVHPVGRPKAIHVAKISDVVKLFPDKGDGSLSPNLVFNP
jgi:hypothetical protein